MPRTVETSIRVRYAETDAQGVVYHSNYLIYFEVARGAFLHAHDVAYADLEAAGTFAVVVEARARYAAPARYDDVLTVSATLSEVRNRSFTFHYAVRRGETLVAEGQTAHVCVDRAGKPVRLPPELATLGTD
ncbi:MAG TPA: thioesterase family protein [Oscillatoriaceae cyanobacterium]